MKPTKPLKKISLVLAMIVLLPALIFTAREFSSLNDSEQLISEIYRQQLEAILFSVNQHAWDVANSWVTRLNLVQYEATPVDREQYLEEFLAQNRAIGAVFFTDSLGSMVHIHTAPDHALTDAGIRAQISPALRSRPGIFRRLGQYQKSGYRKIEPLTTDSPETLETQPVALLFPLAPEATQPAAFAGLVLKPQIFIRMVLFPKLREIAGERFQIAVVHGAEQFSYDPAIRLALPDISEQKEIWLFPAYFLAIRPPRANY